jgi:TPR repeat protein
MRGGWRTLLLCGLALAPLTAAAKAHAPAEERPGRIVLVPMAVERPAEPGWVLIKRTDTELVFIRPAAKDRNSQVAIASGKVPEKRARTTQELAANVRDDLKKSLGDARFELIEEDVRPEPAADRKCVRYRQRARDLGAIGPDGKPHVIDLHGRACLHPDDEGIVVAASLSERGPEARATQGLAETAARFSSGVQPHAPLKGGDWRSLAEQGDANAQVWLARTLLQTNELEEAMVWLGRAAEKGHPDGLALLGLSYLTGRAVTRSPQEALKRLRPAAEKGYPKAEGLLALALITAAEVRDEEEGRRWVRKAAADGDPLGQALLGELLLSGRAGVEKNEAEGAAWIRKAAEQGDARAQYVLASILANGVGVGKDPVQARFWLELAAAQGHADARKILAQARRSPAPAPAESK